VPEYEKLANALDGIIGVGAVDTQAEGVYLIYRYSY